jgi:threonine/homoserine/homoserine lactone efflux protein
MLADAYARVSQCLTGSNLSALAIEAATPLVWAYLLTCLLVELTPGPNMGYLALLSVTRGKREGIHFLTGAAIAIFFYGLLIVFGLHTLLTDHPALMQALQWLGVLYFLFLAWEIWASSPAKLSDNAAAAQHSYFLRGLTTNLLNPKLLMFYVGVMPEFVREGAPHPERTMIIYVLIYVVVATTIHLLIVWLASHLQFVLAGDTRAIRGISACFMLLIALWMLLKEI